MKGMRKYRGIYGVPLTMKMGELVKDVREKCDVFESPNQLTQSGERNEISSEQKSFLHGAVLWLHEV